jgi:hypothetical protein
MQVETGILIESGRDDKYRRLTYNCLKHERRSDKPKKISRLLLKSWADGRVAFLYLIRAGVRLLIKYFRRATPRLVSHSRRTR